MQKAPQILMNTKTNIPAIGFGTWQLDEGREAKDSVKEAIKIGYRLIDTAKIYDNEKSVGQGIHESGVPRDELFITTKLWPSDFGYNSALNAFDESMKRLGLDHLDLYLLHWPERDEDARHEAWKALEKLNKVGRIKNIGVSNFTPAHLEALASVSKVVPAVNQVEFHPFIFTKQLPTLKYCQSRDIVVEAYSPLARAHEMDNSVLRDIASKVGRTVAQVMLRWALQHETLPIPKSAHPSRIKENFDVFGFELSQSEMKAIDGLSDDSSVISG